MFQLIERDITRSAYKPDDLLPSIRDLAKEMNVSPATVAAAFRKLADRGLTYVVRGVGTKVRQQSLLSDALGGSVNVAPVGSIDIASGAPDASLLPNLNTYLHRLDVPTALYNVDLMIAKIRDHAASFMADAIDQRSAHLTIASGALDSISDAASARLRPGDRVIVEDPGFAAASSLLRSHTLTLVPVAVDDEGFEVNAFADAMQQGADAVLYSPRAQNPFGSAITRARAKALRDVIERHVNDEHGFFVIENDHASLISEDEYNSLTPSSDTWLSTRSLSKSHGPDLRFAFVAGDALTIDRIRRNQALNRGWMPTIMQNLVAALLSDEEVQRSVVVAAKHYSNRRQRLIEALADLGVNAHGRSGLNVHVPVTDEGTISTALLTLGWQTRSGQAYRQHADPFIRLTPAALSEEQIDVLARDVAITLHSGPPVVR
nr:aminotransferase class I/II-fold pyridoxal phosphate-dependent enzyme [Brevibacterium luteolum]